VLTEQGEIIGVVCHVSSGVSIEAADDYAEGNLVSISPTSTSVKLSEAGKYFFRTVATDRETAKKLAEYLNQEISPKKVAVFYNSGSAYSKSLWEQFTEIFPNKYKGQIVKEFDWNENYLSAREAVRQARQAEATALVLLPNTKTRENAREVVKEAKEDNFLMVAGDSFYNGENLTDEMGEYTKERLVVATFWHPLASPDKTFPQDAECLWKGSVSARTALAYDATKALIAALKKASTDNRISLQEA